MFPLVRGGAFDSVNIPPPLITSSRNVHVSLPGREGLGRR